MSLNDFGHRYCGARINSFGRWEFRHSSNEAELHTKLQRDFMHVVGEGKLNHPERKRSMLFMSEDVRSRAHRSWEEKHLKELSLDKIDEAASQGDLARFRQELGVRKVAWVAKYIQERLANKNESILLFAWHREVCYALAKELEKWKPGLVIGGTKNDEREKIFADFQLGKSRIIIGNIQAMGRGHNLQKANRVVFAEFSWTDELNKQCEKRSSRRGNGQDFIRCEYVVAPHSMDEMVLSAVFTKAKRVEKVIGE
jgi:SNF2 family DNA or RNA helicase